MSLSEDLRSELAAVDPRKPCDRLAQTAALFHSAGRLHLLGRGRVGLHLDLASSAVARRAFSLLRSFGIHSEIRTYRAKAFARSTRYQLHVRGEDRALQVFHEAGVLSETLAPLSVPPKRVVAHACCRAAYLRGALLAAGSVSGSPSPHLEIRAESLTRAERLAELMAADGVRLLVHDRGHHAVAYAKGVDTIAGVLAAAGASTLALRFAERAVVGATRSRANRLANADHANLVRTSRAAQRQLEALDRLRRSGRLEHLSRALLEIAQLRIRNPSLPLRELALRCDPPVSKAAAQRRLQKLVELGKP